MRMFKVKAGSKVRAVPYDSSGVPAFLSSEEKVTNKDAYYQVEDLRIDPVKPGPYLNTIGWDYATHGWYGFILNSKQWQCMLVRGDMVEVL